MADDFMIVRGRDGKDYKIPTRPGRNGGKLLARGVPGNAGGGKTSNQLRQMARNSLPEAIRRAAAIATGKVRAGASDVVRAAEFLARLGVPAQSEVLEIKDEKIMQWVFESLAEIGLDAEAIARFRDKMAEKAQM